MSQLPANDSLPLADLPPGFVDQSGLIAAAAHRLAGIGCSAARIAGSADDLGLLTDRANQVFGEMRGSLTAMISGNRGIAECARQSVGKAEATHGAVRTALDRAGGLADSVVRVENAISEVSTTLRQVADASQVINKIAFQTRIVAFNASVEAVRAGDAGRGFGVVAQAVKDLAQMVADSSREIATVVDHLGERVRELEHELDQGRGSGEGGDARSLVAAAIDSFESNFGEVEALMRKTAEQSAANLALCDRSVETLSSFGDEFAGSLRLIGNIRNEAGSLLETSEEAIAHFAGSGVETEDSPFIRAVIRAATEVARRFEHALAEDLISVSELFDERYRLIAGTNPQQYTTDFVALTDSLLPAVQETVLRLSPLVSFCVAVDRNGYLPTHNRKFSQPQGADPVRNAAVSRNRRMFKDRTGLRAARNQEPFLLQTYRRDLGGGETVLMKDVSAPIWVQGRHWGALRIGYGFAESD